MKTLQWGDGIFEYSIKRMPMGVRFFVYQEKIAPHFADMPPFLDTCRQKCRIV